MAREMKDSGVEWIGEIPVDWNVVKIKFLRNKEVDSFQDGDWIESPYIIDNGIRYLTTGNVGDGVFKQQGNGYISEETFSLLNCKYAYPNDLVISRLNEPFGRACILPYDEEKYVLAVDIVILRTNNDKRYLCYLMQCEGYQKKVQDSAKGTTMKRISRTNLGNITLPIAPKVRQTIIADYLDTQCSRIDSVIEQTRVSIEEYKKLKQAMITHAVTKGIRPGRKMKDSGVEWISEIPDEWNIVDIGRLFIFVGGYAFTSDRFCDQTIHQVVRMGNVKDDCLLLSEKSVFIDDEYAECVKEYTIKPDDILFTMTGTKGKKDYFYTLLVKPDDIKNRILYINQRVGCFRKRENYYMNYFNYLLKVAELKNYIFLFETGTANQGNLGISTIRKTRLLVPPINEQKEIVKYLDDKCKILNDLIAKKEQIISELESYKKSIIYEYVTGKKRA